MTETLLLLITPLNKRSLCRRLYAGAALDYSPVHFLHQIQLNSHVPLAVCSECALKTMPSRGSLKGKVIGWDQAIHYSSQSTLNNLQEHRRERCIWLVVELKYQQSFCQNKRLHLQFRAVYWKLAPPDQFQPQWLLFKEPIKTVNTA